MKAWKKIFLWAFFATALAAGVVSCGKGVEFGAKTFVLTGGNS